ncbi:MAG TPA: hypothetical protein VG796_00555 [Verrucomicrobiales bacterium]|nr:hypothetical protein [Verrucomicrobiales bacterium]
MKNTRATVLPIVVFAGAMAGAWGVRFFWPWSAETSQKRAIPAGVATSQGGRRDSAPEPSPEINLSDLRSVRSGLVVLPPDATTETIAAAFAEAWKKLSVEGGHHMQINAQQLFIDWLRVDAEAAIRFVSDPPGNLIKQGGEYLLTALAETDPSKACAIAFKGGLDGPLASEKVLKVWGSRDPQAALAFAAGLPAHQRLAAEMSALGGWLAVSGPEAFAWLQSQPESWRRDMMMNRMAVTLLQNSPAEIAELARTGSLPDEMKRSLRKWDEKTDSATLINLVQDALTAGGTAKSLLDVANGLGSTRMAAAVVSAAVQSSTPKDAADVAKLAASLGLKDNTALLCGLGRSAPEAGFAWALENKQPLDLLAAAWAEYDAKSAMQSLLAQPRGGLADEAVQAIIGKTASTAPAEAIEAALQIPMDTKERRKHLSAAARVLARSDPAQAVAALGKIPDAPPEEVSAVLAVSGRANAKAAAAALAQVDLNTNEYIASESLTRGWAIADPAGASEWVRTLPKGDLRDGGAAGLARGVMQSDATAAFAWAMEINDPVIHDRVAVEAVNELKKTRSLEQIKADTALDDAIRGQLATYWNRPAPKSSTSTPLITIPPASNR